MNFRRLTRDVELVRSQECFRELSGVNIPIACYRASWVVGAFESSSSSSNTARDKSQMIGGYCLTKGSAIRWNRLVPSVTAFQRQVAVAEMLEINALWLEPGYRKTRSSVRFWIHLAVDVAAQKERWATYVVDTRKVGLARMYERIGGTIIYEGPLVNSDVKVARVYALKSWKFLLMPALFLRDILSRSCSGEKVQARGS